MADKEKKVEEAQEPVTEQVELVGDAANEFRMGEIVRIEECAPISKLKTWTVVDRIGTAKMGAVEIAEPDMTAPPATEPSKPAEEKAEKKPAAKKPTKKAKAEDVAKADA